MGRNQLTEYVPLALFFPVGGWGPLFVIEEMTHLGHTVHGILYAETRVSLYQTFFVIFNFKFEHRKHRRTKGCSSQGNG